MYRRGDVQPLLYFGQELLARDNGIESVRIATHELYREAVMNAGLEFAPTAGDPVCSRRSRAKGWGGECTPTPP